MTLCVSAADAPLPPSPEPHYVRDGAGWLTPGGFAALDAKLEQFERDTSSQFVVTIFPKLPDDAELFDFSQRLYQAWKPGTAAKDNGAILLIFAQDRKLRIHTGYGMEGVLPDARCKEIISDVIAPLLRDNRREAAVNAGIDAMIAAAKGEYKGTGHTNLDTTPNTGLDPDHVIFIIIFIIVVIQIIRAKGGSIYSDRSIRRWDTWSGGGGGWSSGGGGGGFSSGGFSGGGGSSGGGGASGGW